MKLKGKRISSFSGSIILIVLALLLLTNKAETQIIQFSDSVFVQPLNIHTVNLDGIIIKESRVNFFKTDSIFSFRSPKGYFPSLIHNFGEQAAAPFHFKTKEWLITGAVAGITTALIYIDNDIDDWTHNLKLEHNWINKSSPVITEFGSNAGIFSLAGFGLVSAACKNKKGVQTSLLATQAMITSGVWVHLIKTLTGRERPESDYIFSKSEGGKWYGPYAQFDQDLAAKKPCSSFNSFPSGHTATAFSIATVFALQYKGRPAIPVISYSAATLVGISRLTEHKHWASDVFAGALMGYVCGRQVVSHYNRTHQSLLDPKQSKSKNTTELTFLQNGNQAGILLTW